MKKIIVLLVAGLLLAPGPALAKKAKYEVVAVTNGGQIKGKVTTALKVKDPVINIEVKAGEDPEKTEVERELCGGEKAAGMYILSSAGEVKNAYVIVEKVKKGKAPPKMDLVIDNIDCRFVPLVGISYLKSKYIIKNSDPVLHNTNLGKLLKGGIRRTVYNLALPHKDQVIKKISRVSGLISLKCDAHYWMRAYVYASRHPYVAITDANGGYEIKDLLPGKYKVRFWHEGFEEVIKGVEVKPGSSTELSALFTKTLTPDFLKAN